MEHLEQWLVMSLLMGLMIKVFCFHQIQIDTYIVGQQFDKDGNRVKWWTDNSIHQFQNRTQCFVDQYDQYSLMGYNVSLVWITHQILPNCMCRSMVSWHWVRTLLITEVSTLHIRHTRMWWTGIRHASMKDTLKTNYSLCLLLRLSTYVIVASWAAWYVHNHCTTGLRGWVTNIIISNSLYLKM